MDFVLLRFFLASSLVVDLFSKKVVLRTKEMVREEDIGEKFSVVDDLFYFRYEEDDLEREKILFHLKNAFAHGRVEIYGD